MRTAISRPLMNAENGQLIKLVSAPTVVRSLLRAGSSNASNALKVLNDLDKGAVNVCVLRDGRPVDIKTTVTPQQKAVFEFKPTIWIGVASQIVQGQVMNLAIISNINNELYLLGIASADIVMSGGGPGAHSTSFTCNLENIVMC
jgi:hypothetical protein